MSSKRFPWRVALYVLILGYLFSDLLLFRGPLRRKIDERKPSGEVIRKKAEQLNWVALVNGEEITRLQLDKAVQVHLYRRGKSVEETSEANLKILRRAVLQRLIDDTMIRTYALGEEFEPDPAEVVAYIESFDSQFESPENVEERSRLQGVDRETQLEMLKQQITQKLWLDKEIAAAIAISESDARLWFEENRESGFGFQNPERLRVRHLFLSNVEKDRKAEIETIWGKLQNEGADFEALAKKFSEDERSKVLGGDLGWVSRNRLPEDFASAVFSAQLGTMSSPFQTSLGWHIAEVIEKKPAETLGFEDLKDEIMNHLSNEERQFQIRSLLKKRRKVAAIQVFPANL